MTETIGIVCVMPFRLPNSDLLVEPGTEGFVRISRKKGHVRTFIDKDSIHDWPEDGSLAIFDGSFLEENPGHFSTIA